MARPPKIYYSESNRDVLGKQYTFMNMRWQAVSIHNLFQVALHVPTQHGVSTCPVEVLCSAAMQLVDLAPQVVSVPHTTMTACVTQPMTEVQQCHTQRLMSLLATAAAAAAPSPAAAAAAAAELHPQSLKHPPARQLPKSYKTCKTCTNVTLVTIIMMCTTPCNTPISMGQARNQLQTMNDTHNII